MFHFYDTLHRSGRIEHHMLGEQHHAEIIRHAHQMRADAYVAGLAGAWPVGLSARQGNKTAQPVNRLTPDCRADGVLRACDGRMAGY